MRNHASKTSTLKWYAKFCVWGQYKEENPLIMYLFINATSIILWGIIVLFFDGKFMNMNFPWYSFFIFLGAFKSIFSVVEKYGELNVGYNLVDIYMLSRKDVLKIRLITKKLQLSEYVLGVYIFYFVYKIIKIWWIAILISVAIYFIITVLAEIISVLSYRKSGIKRITFNIVITSIIFIFFSISVGVAKISMFNQMMMLIATIIIANSIYVLIYRGKITIGKRRKLKKTYIPSNITSQLVIKDLKYILLEKTSIIVNPLIYLVVFYFIDKSGVLIKNILPIYFPVEIATEYAFNYFGHDNENLITILLSPIKKQCIIGAKNITYTILSISQSIIFCSIFSALYKVGLNKWIYFMAISLLAHSAMLILCQFMSIKYYFKVKGKAKYTVKTTLIGIGCFISLSVFKVVLDSFMINSFILFGIGCMALFLTIFIGIINPETSAKCLEKEERRMLDSISYDN